MPLPVLVLAAAAQAVAEASVWAYVACIGGGAALAAGATVGVIYAFDGKKEKPKNDLPPSTGPDIADTNSKLKETVVIEVKAEEVLVSSRESGATVKENESLAKEKLKNTGAILETGIAGLEGLSKTVEKNTETLLDLFVGGHLSAIEKNDLSSMRKSPDASTQSMQDLIKQNQALRENNQELLKENQRLGADNKKKDAQLIALSKHISLQAQEDVSHTPKL